MVNLLRFCTKNAVALLSLANYTSFVVGRDGSLCPRQTDNRIRIMASPLEKEFEYYLDHQDELVKKYNGKFVVIKGCSVIGAYDSELQALEETTKIHEMGTFLVQKCEPGSDSYTQSFHSRVSFA